VQAELRAKIPSAWVLQESILSAKPRNVLPLFGTCGVLNARELEITESSDAVEIIEKLRSKEWSAVEVTTAFCKRAAVAQQLVNCLMDIDFEGGIRRARELDEYLARTGEVVGPLHGLPVSLKVG
jgi:amidase